MATSGQDDEIKTETGLDVSGFMRAFADDVDDENGSSRMGEVSMFCKECLHPYCGEEKAGTIVLRCERCGQTDTVLEERVGSLNPEEWIGNLMMNRFMQAVKEQEDLSANLAEPDIIDDDYRRLTHALKDYTNNIEKLANILFGVAKKTNLVPETAVLDLANGDQTAVVYGREVFQAMNAIKALIEVHSILKLTRSQEESTNEEAMAISENAQNEHSNEAVVDSAEANMEISQIEKETVAGADIKDDKHHGPDNVENQSAELENASNSFDSTTPIESNTKESSVGSSQTSPSDRDKAQSGETPDNGEEENIVSIINDYINQIGPTVLKLIESLIAHYGLEPDMLETIHKRLTEKKENIENKVEQNEHIEKQTEMENQSASKTNGNEDSSSEGVNGPNTENNSLGTEEASDNEDDEDAGGSIFNVTTKQLKDEIDKNLKHKLALRFDVTQSSSTKISNSDRLKSDIGSTNSNKPTAANEDTKTEHQTESFSFVQDIANHQETIPSDVTKIENDEMAPGSDNETLETTVSESSDIRTTEDGFYVNVYTLAAEFVREIQRRRSQALDERKNKALANMSVKIDELKLEMERVGKAVTEELRSAYKTKVKKVENQQKHLDEKKKQLKEAERLMHYYAMTGQEEKLADLMAQINMHTANKQ